MYHINTKLEDNIQESVLESVDSLVSGVKKAWSILKRFSPNNIADSFVDDSSYMRDYFHDKKINDITVSFHLKDKSGKEICSFSGDTSYENITLENGSVNYKELEDIFALDVLKNKGKYETASFKILKEKGADKELLENNLLPFFKFMQRLESSNYEDDIGGISIQIDSDSRKKGSVGEGILFKSSDMDVNSFYKSMAYANSRDKESTNLVHGLLVSAAVVGGAFLAYNTLIPPAEAADMWNSLVSIPINNFVDYMKPADDSATLGQLTQPITGQLKMLSKTPDFAYAGISTLSIIRTGLFVNSTIKERDKLIDNFQIIYDSNEQSLTLPKSNRL